MNAKTRNLSAVIAFLLIGLSLIPMLNLTVPQAARAAGVLYVAPTAQGNGNCSSWANACTLQTALAQAVSGDEIWVKAGAHYPGANRTDTFTLKNGVALYGGFAGTETSREQRNWQANKTILSGDIDQNDINTDGNYIAETWNDIVGNNVYHVVSSIDNDATALFDGFVITAGQANGGHALSVGGGMFNTDSSPTLLNLTFSGNTASMKGGGMSAGGGAPILTNVTFSGNSSYLGGGLYSEDSSPILTNVIFNGNKATDRGGGMYNYRSSSPTLTNVTFNDNAANHGGGMHNHRSSSPTLTNVTFSGNSATYDGGGMSNYYQSSPILKNVIIWANTAGAGSTGISNSFDSYPVIAYSDIQGCGGSGANWDSACGVDGGGNIEADPLFVDPVNDNLRLQAASPCIDIGNGSALPPGVTTDLDGNPRLSGPEVDMGAYEVQNPDPYDPLRVYLTGEGYAHITSTPAGIACPDDCFQQYLADQNITLTAYPGPTSYIQAWQGCDTDNGTSCSVTMTPGGHAITLTLAHTPGALYAAPIAQGNGDCSSWANACTLQTALSQALSGDEIWVQAGVHYPTTSPNDRTATFALKNGVALYGGFTGTETQRAQRDWQTNKTVLSGDIDHNDITDPNGIVTDTTHIQGGNSYHVVTSIDTNVSAVLDGFFITAGQANNEWFFSHTNGGGMYSNSSSFSLANVTFSGNTAYCFGGGIYNENGSPTLINITFSSNAAEYCGGGGMYNMGASPSLTNVIFNGNTAKICDGGGMYNEMNSSPSLTKSPSPATRHITAAAECPTGKAPLPSPTSPSAGTRLTTMLVEYTTTTVTQS